MIGGWLLMAALTGVSLPPCPNKPNCVSTQATQSRHAIEPIRYNGTAADAMAKLMAVLHEYPRTKITSHDATTVRAEFTTKLMRFVDDGMFIIDDASKVIHFRSASRIGYGDHGVNRDRMEEIRSRFAAK
jgi:uncharacterized protein (DUF1499 family)